MNTQEILYLADLERNPSHPQREIVFQGKSYYLDEDIVPLLLFLWNKGIKTEYSCQGYSLSDELFSLIFPNQERDEVFFWQNPDSIGHKVERFIMDSLVEIKNINPIEVEIPSFLGYIKFSKAYDLEKFEQLVKPHKFVFSQNSFIDIRNHIIRFCYDGLLKLNKDLNLENEEKNQYKEQKQNQ